MPEPNDSLESQPAAGRARDRKRSGQASWKGEKEFKPGSTASQGFLCFGSAKTERPRPKRAACPSLVCEENFAPAILDALGHFGGSRVNSRARSLAIRNGLLGGSTPGADPVDSQHPARPCPRYERDLECRWDAIRKPGSNHERPVGYARPGRPQAA